MEIKLVKFGWRFYTTINLRRVTKVQGVNSRIDEDTHFLMWDFDNLPLEVVIDSLRFVQRVFNLPSISVLRTKENGYHAYCFKSCSLLEARGIIGFTPNVDKHYLAAGCGRGYFTLRFSDIPNREFDHVSTLGSETPSDLCYSDVSSFVEYTKANK